MQEEKNYNINVKIKPPDSVSPLPKLPEIHELIQRFALDLLGNWLQRARDLSWLEFEAQDGLRIRPEELLTTFRRILSPEITPQTGSSSVTVAIDKLRVGLQKLSSAGDEGGLRWLDFCQRLELNDYELSMVVVLLAMSIDISIARAFRYGWADLSQRTMPAGFFAFMMAENSSEEHSRILDSIWADITPTSSKLVKIGIVRCLPEQPGTYPASWGLSLCEEAVAWFCGWPMHIPEVVLEMDLTAPPMRLRKSIRKQLEKLLKNLKIRLKLGRNWAETGSGEREGNIDCGTDNRVFPDKQRGRLDLVNSVVHGPKGSGRFAVAGQIAMALAKRGVWHLELNDAVLRAKGEQEVSRAIRLGTLLDLAVVVSGATKLGEATKRWISEIESAFANTGVPLVWLLEQNPHGYMRIDPKSVIALGYPSRAERLVSWKKELGELMEEEALNELASRFLLSEGQIEQTAAEVCADLTEDVMDKTLAIARREASLGLGRLAQPEVGNVSLEDMVLDGETHTLIEEIISYAANRHILSKSWGFKAAMPYGLGLTSLFTGPPGTGKTMAANAIARELQLELYRVDLSALVSKYIGETEKHLAEIFEAAEQGEVMLLFDEADSLFGKRTEVKSSVDRYANLEVNYLLQRIEHFDGIVILTTNLESAIDDAFSRRIQFRVAFEEPDEDARQKLWDVLIPEEVPLAQDVDIEELAKLYELSGGYIKEVVLRAASLALDKGSAVNQDLLLRSADAEYSKLGKLPVSY